jgi:hypothetical protein
MELAIKGASRLYRGKVWEWTASSSDLPALRERHLISGTIRHSDGVHVRAVSAGKPVSGAVSVAPRLEDAYLYFVSNGHGGGAG